MSYADFLIRLAVEAYEAGELTARAAVVALNEIMLAGYDLTIWDLFEAHR